jgi:hypothetical protein
MSLLSRLRPPARSPARVQPGDARSALIEAATDADAAALALVVALERRRAAVSAALAAGVVSPALGKRMLTRQAVDRGLHAAGVADHGGVPRSASSHRAGFLNQTLQSLNRPSKGT